MYDIEDYITKRKLGEGRWDKILKRELVARSVGDTYEEAKYEWIVTGNVWYIPTNHNPMQTLPQVHATHPHKCLCSHKIVWHFEIENTENGNLDIVGSEHIESYMIIRELEAQGIKAEFITEQMIEDWINQKVKSMKAKWWWDLHGEQFEPIFEEIKEMDLRVNVRNKGYHYDNEIRMRVPKNVIKKTATGSFGSPNYKMASIVWRWNHPDNPKAQINTRGYPNERLWNDIQFFYVLLASHKSRIEELDNKRAERIAQLSVEDKKRAEKLAVRQSKIEVAQEITDDVSADDFTGMCSYYGIPIFDEGMGSNDWETSFLRDMKDRMNGGKDLTDKQLGVLKRILGLGEAKMASPKQIRYAIHLGYEGETDNLSSKDASKIIDELIRNRSDN
tara:strand:- start:17615 stop:18784 length:1170 start_codon:yes stop_codon:yes gene_type:complete